MSALRVAICTALILALLGAQAASAATYPEKVEAPVYVKTRDGTQLRATIYRPDAPGRFPVVLEYGPYGEGEGYHSNASLNTAGAAELVKRGYAVLEVSVPGTGCSQGVLDPLSAVEARDGYDVIEWAAAQPWSNGKIAMDGLSYVGMDQYFVAALHPPHLVTIMPMQTHADAYRDLAYPGGIPDWPITPAWTVEAQPQQAGEGVAQAIQAGDSQCAQNTANRSETDWLSHSLMVHWAANPEDGPWYHDISTLTAAPAVRVPVLMGFAWQDEAVSARGTMLWNALDVPKRMELSNGIHGVVPLTPLVWQRELQWLDYWMKGKRNGIMRKRPVEAQFEVDPTTLKPAFTRSYRSWPPPAMRYSALYLRTGSALADTPATTDEAPDAYTDKSSQHVVLVGSGKGIAWDVPQKGGATYMSAPFGHDTLMVGPWGLRLFLSTTASDTDVEAILSVVDSAGNTTYVSRGYLRGSHRALDPEHSTEEVPWHYHTNPQPMTPGTVYQLDVETSPIGQLFRKGSRVRLDIIGPNLLPDPGWGFASTPTPAVNDIFHTPKYNSVIWLPIVRGAGSDFPSPPACGALEAENQPCRPAGGP